MGSKSYYLICFVNVDFPRGVDVQGLSNDPEHLEICGILSRIFFDKIYETHALLESETFPGAGYFPSAFSRALRNWGYV